MICLDRKYLINIIETYSGKMLDLETLIAQIWRTNISDISRLISEILSYSMHMLVVSKDALQ